MHSTCASKIMPFSSPETFLGLLKRDILDLSEELWFIFKDSRLLVYADSLQPVQDKEIALACSLYVGKFEKFHVHAGEMDAAAELPPKSILLDLKTLYGQLDHPLHALAGRAVQLILWDRSHQFCGQCGTKTLEKINERAKECPECHLLAFPKISPAIMALIEREDQILLARSPHFPKGIYSVLAGYIDPGETLEQCVRREVLEEVGMHVDDVRYFGSQPWPFPNSLMIAFSCKWIGGDIAIDHVEIEDAQWFKKDALPLLPPEMSISRILIDTYLER